MDYPRIIYTTPDHTKDLDEIFTKLLKYESDYSEKLLEIRKKQIIKHSQGKTLANLFYELSNLIGERQDEYNQIIINQIHERLIELHSPVIFNVPLNLNPYYKWEQWTFSDLYDKYMCLVLSKGWEDFYSLPNDFSKNKHITPFGLDFDVDYELIKNYHIVDMLNDLILNDYEICSYDIRSFLNTTGFLPEIEGDVLLQSFNQTCLISVKTKKKLSREEIKQEIRKS